jgi:[acyl-carrier-protein] S-malonyltransferase
MTRRFAMVFPGQGSQAVGMLQDLATADTPVRETFEEASGVAGIDLWRLTREGPVEELNRTQNTQPAMLAAGVAVWRSWQAADGPAPDFMAGHSLGEYTALVCGGALDFRDAIALVAERGRLMQAAVPEGQGAMAAILGLADDVVRSVCADAAAADVVEAVNFNAPGQVVVAGQAEAVARAVELAKQAGAKRAIVLPVSVPSHCALMKPAADELASRLAAVEVTAPAIPVIHNASAAPENDPAKIRELLAVQLYSPVRWVESVQRMQAESVEVLLEAGPGKVLAGLAKRIDKSLAGKPVFDPAGIEAAKEELL